MVNVEPRILFTNALLEQTGTLTKSTWVLQKVFSNCTFTATRFHLIARATPGTTLFKYVWQIKKKFKIMPLLKWSIIKSV